LAGELLKRSFRKRDYAKENLVRFCRRKTGKKEAGDLKQTLALAVSGEGLREVAVLPQQLLKELLA
jgi:hypothetical protein